MIVTIDGPAGSGKSSVARTAARQLGWLFLDTGATYRAAALKVRQTDVSLDDTEALGRLCSAMNVDLHWDNDHLRVILDGRDVTDAIRTEAVSNLASRIAAVAQVRHAMIEKQRQLATRRDNVITEGRDQGSVVFPHAELKIFLDASVEERARRRAEQLRSRGCDVDRMQVLADLKRRDHQDTTRKVHPMVVPDDAVRLDTTNLSFDQVVEEVLDLVNKVRGRFGHA